MTAKSTDTHRPSAEEILAAAPPVRHEPGARERIRAAHAAAGRRIAVARRRPHRLADRARRQRSSPFSKHAEYAAGLAEPGSTCFILTNTRSLPEDAAVELNTGISGSLFTLGQTSRRPRGSRQPQ